jgi:hypothetical protein
MLPIASYLAESETDTIIQSYCDAVRHCEHGVGDENGEHRHYDHRKLVYQSGLCYKLNDETFLDYVRHVIHEVQDHTTFGWIYYKI